MDTIGIRYASDTDFKQMCVGWWMMQVGRQPDSFEDPFLLHAGWWLPTYRQLAKACLDCAKRRSHIWFGHRLWRF
jgi:hypothetical protein